MARDILKWYWLRHLRKQTRKENSVRHSAVNKSKLTRKQPGKEKERERDSNNNSSDKLNSTLPTARGGNKFYAKISKTATATATETATATATAIRTLLLATVAAAIFAKSARKTF